MQFCSAGIKTVHGELLEAAQIDGASVWQNFRNIIFPLIAPAFTINMVLSLIGSLKVLDIPYLLTGSSIKSTYFINQYHGYASIFDRKLCYGTAISVLLFVIIVSIAFPLLGVLRKREVEM